MAAVEPFQEIETTRVRVRAWLETQVVPHAQAWEEGGEVPREVFREAGRRGFFGLRYAAADGGSGLPYAHCAAYLQELGRSGAWGTMLSLVIQSEIATPILALAGSPSIRRRFLAPALAGEAVAAIAMTEPEGGSDLARLRTRARCATRACQEGFHPRIHASSRRGGSLRRTFAAFRHGMGAPQPIERRRPHAAAQTRVGGQGEDPRREGAGTGQRPVVGPMRGERGDAVEGGRVRGARARPDPGEGREGPVAFLGVGRHDAEPGVHA